MLDNFPQSLYYIDAMPSLVLFGQRTLVSGDDLRCYSTMGILVQILQLAILIPTIVYASGIDSSQEACKQHGLASQGERLI